MAAEVNIVLQRNEDWARTLNLTADDEPIDLTGMTAAMQVREKLTQALVQQAYVSIKDAPGGVIDIRLDASEGSNLRGYGDPIQPAELFYDLRLTDADGFDTILFGGRVVLVRGETRA